MMLLSIDPGTTFCGVVLSEMKDNVMYVHHTELLSIGTSYKSEHELTCLKLYGGRFLKIQRIVTRLNEVIKEFKATNIAVEGSYFNPTRPDAFKALVEFMYALKHSVALPLLLEINEIPAMTVKQEFSLKNNVKKGTFGVKQAMSDILTERVQDGSIVIDKDITTLSEHETDAIAIGFAHHKQSLISQQPT